MSCVSGTEYGMPASRILRLARTSRWRHRSRRHEKRASNLGCLQTPERAECQRDLCLERKGWVAAREYQPQAIVGDFARVELRLLDGRVRRGCGNRFHLFFELRTAPDPVDGLMARGLDNPRGGVTRGFRMSATGRAPLQMLPAQPLRRRRSRRSAGSAWRRSGPNRSDKPPQSSRLNLRACPMVNYFRRECRSGRSPFDLLTERQTS